MRNWRTLKRFLKCPNCGGQHMIKRGDVIVGRFCPNRYLDKKTGNWMAKRYECRKCHHTTTDPIRSK
jgi:hypothetical protein